MPWPYTGHQRSPLEGFENVAPLPPEVNADGKSLVNPPAHALSTAYEKFPEPIGLTNNGFDFHGAFARARVPTCFGLVGDGACA